MSRRSMNFSIFPSESHVMSARVPSSAGPLVQAVDRQDRKELVDGPDVRQRLEDRKVQDVLVGEHRLHVFELLRHFLEGLQVLVDALADLPEEDLALGPILERQVAEVEEREELLLVLDRVVVALAEGLRVDGLVDGRELLQDGRVRVRHAHTAALFDAVGDVEDVRHEDRVVRGHGAAGLGHEHGRGYLLLVADLLDRVDHVIGVLLHGIVHGRVERRFRAVVVHAEAAAEVQVLDRDVLRPQLRVHAAGFADRLLDLADVGDLRADVKVQHDQTIEHLAGLEDLDRLEHLGRGEAELGRLAAGFGPLSRAAGVELGAHADQGAHAPLLRDRKDPLELGDLLEDQDHLLLHSHGVERHAHERLVLVSVARDEALGPEVGRDGREQLGLGAGLEAVAVAPARLDDVVHDDALLVDLDREDAAEDVAVAVLVDGARERVIQVRDRRGQDLGKADDHRRGDAAGRHVIHDLLERDAARGLPRRTHDEIAVLRHVEKPLAPVRECRRALRHRCSAAPRGAGGRAPRHGNVARVGRWPWSRILKHFDRFVRAGHVRAPVFFEILDRLPLSEDLQDGDRQGRGARAERGLRVRRELRGVKRGQLRRVAVDGGKFAGGVAPSQNIERRSPAARPNSPKSSPAMIGGHSTTRAAPKAAASAPATRRVERGVVVERDEPCSTCTCGRLRRARGRGLRLGDALDRREDALADLGLVRAHGQLQLHLVGDDVVLGAAVDRADRDHGRVERVVSRLTIVCRSRTMRAASTIGSMVVCGAEPWPPLPWTVMSTESDVGQGEARRVADLAGRQARRRRAGRGEVGLREARRTGRPSSIALAPPPPLLGGLADEHQRAAPAVLRPRPAASPCRPAGHVHVVAAGVHDATVVAGVVLRGRPCWRRAGPSSRRPAARPCRCGPAPSGPCRSSARRRRRCRRRWSVTSKPSGAQPRGELGRGLLLVQRELGIAGAGRCRSASRSGSSASSGSERRRAGRARAAASEVPRHGRGREVSMAQDEISGTVRCQGSYTARMRRAPRRDLGEPEAAAFPRGASAPSRSSRSPRDCPSASCGSRCPRS